MHTRCPECQTVFLITEQQLNAAAGKARCGRCGAVFDARAALLDEQRQGGAPETDAPEMAASETAPDTALERPASEPAAEAQAPAPADTDDAIPAVLLEDFAQLQAPRRRSRLGLWVLAALLLGGALVLQYAYFMRHQLVDRYPQSRPWLVRMCSALSAVVPCDVPLTRDLTRLRMLSSEVSEHPTQPGALLIQATFVNTASFAQPYPVLEVKLSDLRGQPVALRRFEPEEYLHSDVDIDQGMAPRTPVTASIEVARPFADVNSYRFAFY